MLSHLRNITKTMEGYSKSHFSHVRNEVEKTTLKPPIPKNLLELKSVQDAEKTFRNRYKKSELFYQTF